MQPIKLSQENIDLLMKGREIIDRHLERKADLKPADSALDAEVTKSTIQYKEELAELGFKTVADFIYFNDEMCLQAQKESTPFVSVCDHCKGYKGIPSCKEVCGIGISHYDTWKGSDEDYDNLYVQMLKITKIMTEKDYEMTLQYLDGLGVGSTVKSIGVSPEGKITQCPEGHGFEFIWNGVAPFPLRWYR